MKHLFIVNPLAGKGKGHELLVSKILEVGAGLQLDVSVYVTKKNNDGYDYIKEYLGQLPHGSNIRVYSCGGDGSLNEVMNGAFEFRDIHVISVGCVPTGTGNDFVRNFKSRDFLNIEAQFRGRTRKVDLIRYQYSDGNDEMFSHCVNMFNIGFDCEVVYRTSILKNYPFLHGSLAYLVGILFTLIKKKVTNVEIDFDDGVEHKGELLMVSIGNGSYCGGGLPGLPKARVDDGLMDIILVKNIPRRAFISLFPPYSKGEHLEISGVEKIITYKQCKKLLLRPNGGRTRLCVDGEISEKGPVEFTLCPLAIDFIVPEI